MKLILSFTYIPTNLKSHKETLYTKDIHGNTALHEAYRLKRPEMVNMLKEHELANQKRNYRGMLPQDMNHRSC